MYSSAIEHFEKRIHNYTKLEWLLLPHSSLAGPQARNEESARILSRLSSDDFVILFDETGSQLSSPDIARLIEQSQTFSKQIVCIIGGAHGVNDELRSRATTMISFGRAVFPHQLMRVLVLEQIYRGYSILAGSGYHHD